jgi:hypothetical protein
MVEIKFTGTPILVSSTSTQFLLEEFYIGKDHMNYSFKGTSDRPECYDDCDHHLVHVKENELEMVKNFLLTIRD